ncbi:hypothetical protein [Thermofilum sp.]|jgi:hypothetical protein|uniref:hypothetical protein n=1 Tax=Thermofilum sp. TaxID=1961369 RepID=UPI002587F6FF|nr:hypothetical protein [Thermofilum sp.]
MENRTITEGEGGKEVRAPADPYTEIAKAVWQSIASILEGKSKAQYVFIPAKSVVKRHLKQTKPHILNYIDRYIAAQPVPGWTFVGIMYQGKRYKKVGKHYVYVRSGYEKKVWREVEPWIRVRAVDLLKDWRVPVYPKPPEKGA